MLYEAQPQLQSKESGIFYRFPFISHHYYNTLTPVYENCIAKNPPKESSSKGYLLYGYSILDKNIVIFMKTLK